VHRFSEKEIGQKGAGAAARKEDVGLQTSVVATRRPTVGQNNLFNNERRQTIGNGSVARPIENIPVQQSMQIALNRNHCMLTLILKSVLFPKSSRDKFQ